MSMKIPATFLEVITGGFCQYITGDPKENPVFCTEKALRGSAYCEKHNKDCNLPPPPPKKRK